MKTRCSDCNAQRSVTLFAQQEALAMLSTCRVDAHYLGDGLYRLEYEKVRRDRQPMIAYLMLRDMVEEAHKLMEERTSRKRRGRRKKNNDN